MQIRKDYLKTFRESTVERMKGMGLAKLPILVHSEILFQANFKSHYLIPKGQAQNDHSTAILTLGRTIFKVHDFSHVQSDLKSSNVAYIQFPVAYLKGILCMQISKTPTPQR